MNILMISPYVSITSRPEFSRNKTGFGYMVMDIAKAVGKLEQVDVLATDTRGEAFEYEGVRFIKRVWESYLRSISSCLPLSALIRLRKEYRMSNGSFVRLIYYWLMTGYLRQIIEKGNYYVVHIHGCGFGTELWMRVCKQCNRKFVVTLHGLNSFSETVRLEPAGKKYERVFLKRVIDGGISITVISTGMKKLIEKTHNAPGCKNITVVCNSFLFNEKWNRLNIQKSIREKYNIPHDAKALLYVGNISHNKNQEQMVRAFALLSDKVQKNTYVMFCGADYSKDGILQNVIEQSPNKSHLIFCGAVDKERMGNYYQEANGVVLLSYAEGFGLSLVEGMHFGLPCAMPNDLDAFEDIYDPNSVVAINNRDDLTVAKAIEYLITSDWDSSLIVRSSKRFDSNVMAQQYLEVYKKIL